MIEINKVIGKNLMMLRKEKKLTQFELAEKFNYSDKTISKWENGESLPSIETLYDLANFYGVTLNDLTNDGFSLTGKKRPKERDKMLPTKLIITLLAVSAVWLCATVVFVSLKIALGINYGLVFVWAIPVSCIVLLIFNSVWGNRNLLFPILSALIWTTLVSVHIPLSAYNDWIAMIYFIGIPLQIAVILWGCINRKPSKGLNKIIEKTKKVFKLNKEEKVEASEVEKPQEENK